VTNFDKYIGIVCTEQKQKVWTFILIASDCTRKSMKSIGN